MLSCPVKLAGKYSHLAPLFMAGLKWLAETDIHSLADGLTVNESHPERDTYFYDCPESYGRVLLNAGDFIIVIPEEAHMPKCAVNGPENVRKAVIKVKA